MNTDQLVDMLARNAGPAPRTTALTRLIPAMLFGGLCSMLLSWWLIEPLPIEIFYSNATAIKLSYAALLAVAACWLTARLARPIAHVTGARRWVVGTIAFMMLAAVLILTLTPANQRLEAIFGNTWLTCPWTLMSFSLPALAAILWAVRGLAPTQLAGAGGACGLLAGALGAMGYALVCPEQSSVFIAIWYTLGILLTAWIGRILGPIVLRW